MSAINPRSPKPKYQQLTEVLLDLIENTLQTDDAIPSEGELQERFDVSRMTVRKAVDQLVNDNRLYRVAGIGTFVADQPRQVELHLSSFTEDMNALGLRPGQITTRLEEASADETLANEVAVATGDKLVLLERTRTADERPVCFERSYMPDALVPGFSARWRDQSLFALLHDEYDLRPTWAQQRIGATSASPEAAATLHVAVGSPLLMIKQRAFKDKLLVEYCASLYRPDRYELAIVLNSAGLALTPGVPKLASPW
jgi:GntR family transcriptional regulator